MPRKRSKAVPKGNCSVPQQEELESDQPTLADVYRLFKEIFDKMDMKLNGELAEKIRPTRQYLAGLEQDARQPRLAPRKCTENAAADQAKYRHDCSAKRINTGPSMYLTSFGDDSTEPPALPCRDDAMVDKDAAVSKPCPLTREDAHTSSRRWLTSRWHSLYSNEDHFSRPLPSGPLVKRPRK